MKSSSVRADSPSGRDVGVRGRILFVIATLDPAGAERQLVRLCLGIKRREFQPAVCCLTRGGPLEQELIAAGVPVWVLGKRAKFDFSILLPLVRIIHQFKPDIVHTWLFTANSFGRAGAILARAPIIIASERAADLWKSWCHRTIDRFLGRFTARVIANAEAVRRFCIQRIGLPAEKVIVVRNGIDLAAFDRAASCSPVPPLKIPEGALLIGTVARLSRQKGISYLLKALPRVLAEIPSVHLLLVGEGEDRPTLEGEVEKLKLSSHVTFLGHRFDVPAILSRLDLFVLPSLWEGLPNAIIEAMAARLPVVATRVDGNAELVEDGVTGYLCPSASPEALAERILLLARDRAKSRRMGEAGRLRIEREFGEDRMIAETCAVYEELLASFRRGVLPKNDAA